MIRMIKAWMQERDELAEDAGLEPLSELFGFAVMIALGYISLVMLIAGVLWALLPMPWEHALGASIMPAGLAGWILFDWLTMR